MSNNDEDLSKEVCEACSPNAKRLTASEEKLLLKKLPSWNIKNHQNVPQITKQFNFDNFQQAIKFANQVGENS
jgi:4a-hydroxytetrahydrobiopterin dehydratase